MAFRMQFFSVLWASCMVMVLATSRLPAQNNSQITSFRPAPRTLQQHLVRAKRALQESEYGEAVAELGALLAEQEDPDELYVDTQQDFFVPPFTGSSARASLKSEARRLLGNMPQAARELYELQFGAEATALLKEAAVGGDVAKLKEVTRKYFHTTAGYEATLLLGRMQLDRGHPLAAAMCFERLAEQPSAARQFEPEVSLLLASCWLYAERPDRAKNALEGLRTRFPKLAIQIGGQEIDELPARDVQQWLAAQLGNGRPLAARAASQWVVFRGDGSRNAPSAGGSPLPGFRWRVPTASDSTDESLIKELRSDRIERRDPVLPALHALAVQNVVLMRTPKRLLALDFGSGKRVWEYPWWDASTDDISISNRPNRGDGELQARRDRLSQRLWSDAPYGQVSSDGKSVFMLDNLRQAAQATASFVQKRGMRFPNPNAPEKHNELVALDLRREGSLRWRIGSDTGLDEPKVAGAFFLGPPLPVSGMLYVMAEINGEVRLLALNPETGRQAWSQQLAHVDSFTINRDSVRRLAGASPSYADGVLICPTTAGAVVAVDVTTRSLLWGYQYEPPRKSTRFGFGQQFRPRTTNSNDHWQDASLTLDDGVVLVAPVDSNRLVCLDMQLKEGKPRWTRLRDKELAEAFYVGCIYDGKAVVVTKHSVVAINMKDEGLPVWDKPVELDRAGGEMPSGRGFHAGGFYYLPTTKSRLLQIDLQKGKIFAEMHSETPLGNLICYQDEVISHSAGAVSCFFQIDPLRSRVAAILQESADDPWALARQGELLLHDGQNAMALASLKRAHEVDPGDDTVQGLLVSTYLTALRKDFASYHAMSDQIEPMIDLPAQQTEYLQLMARGYHRSGKLEKALEAYVKLSDLRQQTEDGASAEPFLVKVDQGWSVRIDRWIHARLRELADADEPAITEQLANEVKARAASASERTTTQLQSDVASFDFHADSNPLKFALAERLLEAKRLLEAEHLLSPMRDHPDLPTSGRASALMAKLYMAATEYESATSLYRELGTRWADVVCDGGKTGRQLLEEGQTDPKLEPDFRQANEWPWGEVTNSQKTQQTSQSLARLVSIPVKHAGLTPRGRIKIGFDNRFNKLTVRDASGRELFKASVNRSVANGVDHAQFIGHQGFIFFGTDLIAVDTLRSTRAQSQSGDAIRWQLNVAPPLESPKQEPGRTNPFSQDDVRLRRNFDQASGRAICSMGPVNRQGVFYQRLKKLVCADAATGEPVWSRIDQPQGATIFGDHEFIFVVADDSDKATVLRAADGGVVGERQLPAVANRWTFAKRYVLAWEEQGQRYRVYLRDIIAETDVWSEEVGPGTVGDVIGDGRIAMLQRNGRFFIRTLDGDQLLVRRRLEADEKLNRLKIVRSGDQYLVFASTSLPEIDAPSTFPAHTTNAPLFTARLYSFDVDTGNSGWQVPAIIDRYGFPLSQPTDSPALWFLRKTTTKQTLTSPQNSERTSLMCIDRRTGRIVLEQDNVAIQPNEFNITTDASRRASTLNLQGQAFTVEFTDLPSPPAPPAQTGAASSLNFGDNRLAGAAGSVFKVFGKQTPGEDPFGDPQPE